MEFTVLLVDKILFDNTLDSFLPGDLFVLKNGIKYETLDSKLIITVPDAVISILLPEQIEALEQFKL